MIAVLDASVVVKWFLGEARGEPHTTNAIAVLRGVDSGRCAWFSRRTFSRDRRGAGSRAAGDRDLLSSRSRGTSEWPWIYSTAMEHTAAHHLFDTLYHATAMHHEARF